MSKQKTRIAKVPVVMQMEALECGAASLTMILSYYGKWLPLEQVRAECGVSRDGSNAKNILRAARNYGLNAKGYRMNREALVENGSFPCIVYWNNNHFAVLCGFRGKYAYMNDPARGSVKISLEEFEESYSGICLSFEPSESFEAGGSRKSTLSFAKKRLVGAGAAVAFVSITGIMGYVFTILSLAFSRFFMDRLLTGENTELLMPFIALLTTITALQIVVLIISEINSLKINGKMAIIGSSTFLWKVLHLPVEFFSQRMAADIQSRYRANATVAESLINTLAPLVLSVGMTVFYLAVMLRYSPILTIIGLISVAMNIYVSRLISRKRVNITRVHMRDEGKLAAATVSAIQLVETIKATGAENGYFKRWGDYQADVNKGVTNFTKVNQYLGTVPMFVTALANAAVLIVGVWFCMQGRFTLGMVMAFQSLLAAFLAPVMTIVSAGQTLQEMRTQMERIEDVMEYPDSPSFNDTPADDDVDYEKLSSVVELKNITFGYSPLSEPLIRDFSLTMRPGDRVALVGASGCGKSTIAKLVSGLYQPWSGEILFDGKPIADIDRDVFTGSVAVVDQDVILFNDTVSANIKMWDNSIEDFEVILAARDAGIHEDIMSRPGGYQRKITEGGHDLSGGQRQRLEIARALAQDPKIIIMDEATSALDAATEYSVMEAVRRRGVTMIIIAHRLSTVRDCDEIIVLDRGQVVERGTHDALYAKGGYYTELISNV